MHYYNFNIADYRKDTGHLSAMEHYIYRTLIDWYYLDERPIPKNNPEITQQEPKITQGVISGLGLGYGLVIRRLRLGSESEINSLKNVLFDFFSEEIDCWRHKKIDADIFAYHQQCVIARKNGLKGGRPKALSMREKTQGVISGLGLANPELTQSKPRANLTNNQEPITNNQEQDLKNNALKSTTKAEKKIIKEKSAIKSKEYPILPDWIDLETWDLWLKTRGGKKMIPEQMCAQINKLRKWRDAGLDHAGALRASAESGWTGLFEPQQRANLAQATQTENQRVREAARKIIFGEKTIESI